MTLVLNGSQWTVEGIWRGQEVSVPLTRAEASMVFEHMAVPAWILERANG